MDVVINSNIQSPLVRTLARTKGKSEAFTQHLKDNVPPVSFSKIELSPEGGSTASYGQTYKFKLPQYGYLRNFVLRFSNTELPIPTSMFATIDTALDALPADAREMVGVERSINGSSAAGPNNQTWMWHAYVPPDEGNNIHGDTLDPWAQMWLRVAGGEVLTDGLGSTSTALGAARLCPFRYKSRNNTQFANSPNYGPRESAHLGREGPIYGITSGVLDVMPTANSNNRQKEQSHGERINSTWDWCSQANLSKHLGAIFPEHITLTTHNRPIQTIYPMESLARIYRMPWDLKKRYLAMIRPHITNSPGSSTAVRTAVSAYQTNRSWTCYFPCFFAFFEDTSMNLDTRFVENLEVDVKIRTDVEIYDRQDIGEGSALTAPTTGGDNYDVVAGTDALSMPFHSQVFRGTDRVLPTTFTLEAIAYYHNFHDTTSQAIRDANYKPNVPANLLTYNTYAENPVFLTQATVMGGGTVNVNLSCNNLAFGITVMVRRRSVPVVDNGMQGHQRWIDVSQTLPIKQITLTGSGQQLYKASGAEALLVDSWDHPLSSMKSGCGLTNTTGLYADNHQAMYVQSKDKSETFFAYYIPFGFSQDMTYNSGSLALQTINNPVLTIELHPLEGWVLNDENMAQYLMPFCNRGSQFQEREEGVNAVVANDNDYEIAVYENFWRKYIDYFDRMITKKLYRNDQNRQQHWIYHKIFRSISYYYLLPCIYIKNLLHFFFLLLDCNLYMMRYNSQGYNQ